MACMYHCFSNRTIFCCPFFSTKRAIREAERELQEIRNYLQQNQILHLSVPDRELEETDEICESGVGRDTDTASGI